MARERRRGKPELALTVATATATATGHKFVAAALKRAGTALGRFRDGRVERMWASAMRNVDDPVAFTGKIEAALLRDGDEVAQGFVAAATAAANAVAPSVVPPIGLLARWFLAPRLEYSAEPEPSRRLYRALLFMLQQLDDEEFGALRNAMHSLATIPSEPADRLASFDIADPAAAFSTMVHRDSPAAAWQWFCRNTKPGTVLIEGTLAPRIVRALLPVLEEADHNELAAEQRPRTKPTVPRRLVELLVSIMPIDPGSTV